MKQATKTERGLWMQITSKRAFRQFLDLRDMTIQEVADQAGCSRSTIGYLHNPKDPRNTVSPDLARRIAKAIDAPVEAVFIVRTPTVKLTA